MSGGIYGRPGRCVVTRVFRRRGRPPRHSLAQFPPSFRSDSEDLSLWPKPWSEFRWERLLLTGNIQDLYDHIVKLFCDVRATLSTAPGCLTLVLRGIRSGVDRKSTRLNSSHLVISYAVFCLK